MQKKLTSIIIVGNQNKIHSLINFKNILSEKVWYKKLDIERSFKSEKKYSG